MHRVQGVLSGATLTYLVGGHFRCLLAPVGSGRNAPKERRVMRASRTKWSRGKRCTACPAEELVDTACSRGFPSETATVSRSLAAATNDTPIYRRIQCTGLIAGMPETYRPRLVMLVPVTLVLVE